eukprot:11830-Heterococcus_DN1.PRE.8
MHMQAGVYLNDFLAQYALLPSSAVLIVQEAQLAPTLLQISCCQLALLHAPAHPAALRSHSAAAYSSVCTVLECT